VGPGEYDPEKVYGWLQSRVGKLEAVVFSGGEALMQGDATISFIKRVRELGFAIGLHTNGFYPKMLERAAEYVDWIGLDYKATREKYESLVGNSIAYDNMIQSLEFWQSTGKDFEVRITCDPRFIDKNDLIAIVRDLSNRGVQTVAIQKYINHFEDSAHQTTPEQREQFFNDAELRKIVTAMVPKTVWRE
jgi:pyruvate formate lyase activating enzyme